MLGLILAPFVAFMVIILGLVFKLIDVCIWIGCSIYAFIMSFPKLTLFVTLWFLIGMIHGGEMNPANWL